MTEKEKEFIVGAALIEYQTLKKTLACMEAKAAMISDQLHTMGRMLKDIPDFDGTPPAHNPSFVPKISSHEDCFSLICQIWETRQKIGCEREQLQKMGVQFPIE